MQPVHYHDGMFPPEERLDWQALMPLIGPAYSAVARFDGMLAAIPNPRVLLAPLTTREAVLSSRIEGTQATMGEVLEYEAGHRSSSTERQDDIREVLNYRAAMRTAETMLDDLPLSTRVVRELHRKLLSGARGMHKSPGEYRRVANWIGPPGCRIDDAKYVPIGADGLEDAISRWEGYIHTGSADRLVQAGIVHAEFEALHPFLDGNGRVGRMLVPLFLWQRGIIQQPVFYISAYFEAHRDQYYENLLAVSRDDNWTGWCRFFLDAVREQASDNLAKAQGILDLYERLKQTVSEATRSRHSIQALDWIFSQPVFARPYFARGTGLATSTASRILDQMRSCGILTEIRAGSGPSPAILAFPDLLRAVEGPEGI